MKNYVRLVCLLLFVTGCWAKLPYIIKYNCYTNASIRPAWLQNLTTDEDYTALLPPNPDGCPTYVRVDVVPFSLGRVSIPDMTFDMDLYIGLLWEDNRLKIPYDFDDEIGLDAETAESIWTPTVDFRNSHTSRSIVKFDPKKDKLKIRGRQLLYYVRRFAKFHCNFDISWYPMDQQLCNVEVQAVGDEKDTVILLDHVHYYDLLSHEIPTEFTLSEFSSGTCQKPDFTAPELTCIEYRFILSRRCGDHYLLSYMPSILVVLLSWLALWIDANSLAPRLAIGLTAMLTMISHFSIELREIPPVSYVKAIDIWIFGCLLIVFLSIIEASIANAYVRRKRRQEAASAKSLQRIHHITSYSNNVQPRNWENQWGLRRREQQQVRPYVSSPEEFNSSQNSGNQGTNQSIRMKDQPNTNRNRVSAGLPEIETPPPMQNEQARLMAPPNYPMPMQDQVMESDNMIDKVARIAFPLMFLIFNICYWSYYQSQVLTLPQEVD